jgi:hypothetical protein
MSDELTAYEREVLISIKMGFHMGAHEIPIPGLVEKGYLIIVNGRIEITQKGKNYKQF